MNDLIQKFWYPEDKATPMTIEEIKTEEGRMGFVLPQFLKDIYSISNGGRTSYICYPSASEKISLFQNGPLLPMNEWQSLSEITLSFDEEVAIHPLARVISRYGSEYFVVLVPTKDGKDCWVGQLDVMDEEPEIRKVCNGSQLSKLIQV